MSFSVSQESGRRSSGKQSQSRRYARPGVGEQAWAVGCASPLWSWGAWAPPTRRATSNSSAAPAHKLGLGCPAWEMVLKQEVLLTIAWDSGSHGEVSTGEEGAETAVRPSWGQVACWMCSRAWGIPTAQWKGRHLRHSSRVETTGRQGGGRREAKIRISRGRGRLWEKEKEDSYTPDRTDILEPIEQYKSILRKEDIVSGSVSSCCCSKLS